MHLIDYSFMLQFERFCFSCFIVSRFFKFWNLPWMMGYQNQLHWKSWMVLITLLWPMFFIFLYVDGEKLKYLKPLVDQWWGIYDCLLLFSFDFDFSWFLSLLLCSFSTIKVLYKANLHFGSSKLFYPFFIRSIGRNLWLPFVVQFGLWFFMVLKPFAMPIPNY